MGLRGIIGAHALIAVCSGKPEAEPQPPQPAKVEHAGGPQDVTYAYAGKAEQDDPAPAKAEPAAEPAASAIDPEALEDRVHEAAVAALPGHEELLVSPPLPIGWPATPGKVLYVIWPLDAIQGGLDQWRVGKALGTATVTLEPETIAVEPIAPAKKAKALGTIERGRPRGNDPVRAAESALLEIVTGKREPEKARYLFKRYDEWIDRHAVVGSELRARAAPFFAWAKQ
jgi:hypothetical protein